MSSYDFVDAEYGILGIECLLIAIIAGISKGSFKLGLATFAIMVILYIIPFVWRSGFQLFYLLRR